jgi:hypothetical protein
MPSPPPSKNLLSLRIGRALEARASGWGVVALVALALIAATLGLAAPGLMQSLPGVSGK